MAQSLKKKIKKILVDVFFKHVRTSYAQSGEDIIISDLFTQLAIQNPTYLDIGANEPIALSNTYRLYIRGSKGVCLEPNPILCEKIIKKRGRDICINAGVAFDEQTEADYYLFSEKAHGLNTFSKSEAEFWEHTGNEQIGKFKVEKIIKTRLIGINEIMGTYFSPHPNFVSIDVEGLDFEILKRIDFNQFKPEVFCIETLSFAESNKELKNQEIISFFESKGYFIYADTYINTIFCRKEVYKNLI